MATPKQKKRPRKDDAAARREAELMKTLTGSEIGKREGVMPLMYREAAVSNLNETDRTFDMVWSTGAPVRRYDWYRERFFNEELSMTPAHIRMGRLNSGRAPVLNTHSMYDLSDVLGVVRSASLTGSEGIGKIKMSQREDVADIIVDLRDGIIGNVSVGYRIYKMEMIAPTKDGDVWTYRAVDWEPHEVSLVPIGADDGASARSESPLFSCEFFNPADDADSHQEHRMNWIVFARAMGIKFAEGADEAAVRSAICIHYKLRADATDEDVAAEVSKAVASRSAPAVDDAAAIRVAADNDARQRAADIITFCDKHRADAEFQAKAVKDGWTRERCAAELLEIRAANGDATAALGGSGVLDAKAQDKETGKKVLARYFNVKE